jgi:hypothetical protein
LANWYFFSVFSVGASTRWLKGVDAALEGTHPRRYLAGFVDERKQRECGDTA